MPAGDMLTFKVRSTDRYGLWYGINRKPRGSVWWDASTDYPFGYMTRENERDSLEAIDIKVPCIRRPTA